MVTFFVITLHRLSNVDNVQSLQELLDVIPDNTGDGQLILPVHLKTKKILTSVNYAREKLITFDPISLKTPELLLQIQEVLEKKQLS